MKLFSSIFAFLLFLVLLASLYFLYNNLPTEEVDFIEVKATENEGNIEFVNSQQFYENMRFPDKAISYNILEDCNNDKAAQVIEGIEEIRSKTVLTFYPSNLNPQIIITCSDIVPDASSEKHFVAGEGGPTKIINTSLYAVILEGKVSLFREESCDEPKIVVHEFLHVLGFDHNNNPNSLLYPTLDCEQEVDEYIIRAINKLYSTESLADLSFGSVNASKSGRYLNFEIEVLNRGLRNSENVILSVYAEGDLVKEFELGDISIGTSKKLNVENLKISRNDENIVFFLDENEGVKEIFENNNKIELKIEPRA